MSSTVVGTLALVGVGFILFALFSILTGRINYVEGDQRQRRIFRSERPREFWLTTIGLLAGGIVLLAVAAFFYTRG